MRPAARASVNIERTDGAPKLARGGKPVRPAFANEWASSRLRRPLRGIGSLAHRARMAEVPRLPGLRRRRRQRHRRGRRRHLPPLPRSVQPSAASRIRSLYSAQNRRRVAFPFGFGSAFHEFVVMMIHLVALGVHGSLQGCLIIIRTEGSTAAVGWRRRSKEGGGKTVMGNGN